MGETCSSVTEGAGVADGGKDGPAAVAALDVGDATSLAGVPVVDATGSTAGAGVAAETGTHFVHDVHIELITIFLFSSQIYLLRPPMPPSFFLPFFISSCRP
jgi:hypothetical protein